MIKLLTWTITFQQHLLISQLKITGYRTYIKLQVKTTKKSPQFYPILFIKVFLNRCSRFYSIVFHSKLMLIG